MGVGAGFYMCDVVVKRVHVRYLISWWVLVTNAQQLAKMGDRLATTDMGRKLGPQCGLGRGLPLYEVASWSIQPFGHNR